jgi:hypothetical protein
MRVGGSKPPSKSGMSWLKQKEQLGARSDMGTPGAEAYQNHRRRVVERSLRRSQVNFKDERWSLTEPTRNWMEDQRRVKVDC